ncbi:unnamed protein product [Rotaria magnacalcarata]|uniref:Reverse transcriptase domain-containing protein n=2 Tax=Rotaria magnacalcarata TaxID=392030 RepID=A0A816WQA1_9BILA|nr:unnamed protein product [Rotaria magnacalcarata]CAF2137108.1 unnamed protein product [Rotaria magnacalcarata]CAF4007054.1 unnamed protein product [Rotaria magnacalcarata]CAF4111762.1 unnamed protein product [Rotaria magnacalcarata]
MTYNNTAATSDKENADLFADCIENDVYYYTDDTLPFHDQHLTKLFNQILKQVYIPTKWKTANIILILKPKKDKQHPSSYRPISLVNCLGKLLEKIIKQRLMLELERRNILPEHQAGFRPGKSQYATSYD